MAMVLSTTSKRVVAGLGIGLVAVNLLAYRQARAFTHFVAPGHRTRPEEMSAAERLRVMLVGFDVPRPVNRTTPGWMNLSYERHLFAGGRGAALEAWLIPRANSRGTVLLFHGHANSKQSLLQEAKAFHQMGLNAFLVDFYGSGGSSGNDTSVGFYEALDVTRAFGYARSLPGSGPVVLYGASMGAAAVLKAVADDDLQPAGLVLECPFDSLIGTVRHRFTSWRIPSFPLADLLVFWGGIQGGFNAFSYRPIDSASLVDRPTLLMNGDSDPWVRPEEARGIFEGLRGPKTLRFFRGVGHASCLCSRPREWKGVVAGFLDQLLGPTEAGAD
jgi:uncharacterized protein